MPDPFQYNALRDPSTNIRIVKILPGEEDAPIECTIFKQQLVKIVVGVRAITSAGDLSSVAANLFECLEIQVPPRDGMRSIQDMLDANPADLPLGGIMWAAPEHVIVFGSTSRAEELTSLVGMYIIAMCSTGEHIMFEFLLHCRESSTTPPWVMRRDTELGTWMLIRGEWVKYRSKELNDYTWPRSVDENTAGTGKYPEQTTLEIERRVAHQVKAHFPIVTHV